LRRAEHLPAARSSISARVLAVPCAGTRPGLHGRWPQGRALGYRWTIRPSRREPFIHRQSAHPCTAADGFLIRAGDCRCNQPTDTSNRRRRVIRAGAALAHVYAAQTSSTGTHGARVLTTSGRQYPSSPRRYDLAGVPRLIVDSIATLANGVRQRQPPVVRADAAAAGACQSPRVVDARPWPNTDGKRHSANNFHHAARALSEHHLGQGRRNRRGPCGRRPGVANLAAWFAGMRGPPCTLLASTRPRPS